MDSRLPTLQRRLLGSFLIVVVLLGGAILVASALVRRETTETLSRAAVRQTARAVEAELERFFEPARKGLSVCRGLGQAGLLDADDPTVLRLLLVPLAAPAEHVKSILVADERGHEFMLLREDDRWVGRQTRPDEWGERARWLEWTDADSKPVVDEMREVGYDARTRPWFRQAMEAPEQDPGEVEAQVRWTEPYTFFTTKQPGITGTTTFRTPAGLRAVIAFDLLLDDISEFTTELRAGVHGRVVVLHEDLRVVGLPAGERFRTEEQRAAALLQTPDTLGLDLVATASRELDMLDEPGQDPRRFESGSETWWGEARPFPIGVNRYLWIYVLVPERDLIGGLERLRVWILLFTALVLAGAVLLGRAMARSVTRPIESLVAATERIRAGDLERHEPIRAQSREVAHLAEVHEEMRLALRTLLDLEREIELAREVQQATFPRVVPTLTGFEIEAWSEPAAATGGDTYDVIGVGPVAGGRSALVLGEGAERALMLLADATGHGLGPALSVTQVRAMLRMAARAGLELPEVVRFMNDQLCHDLTEGRFVTVWLGRIDAASGILTSLSAGQSPLLAYRAAEGCAEQLGPDGPPLGILPDAAWQKGFQARMQPGDLFLVVSDGIHEAKNEAGDTLGIDRIRELVETHHARPAAEFLRILRDVVERWTGGAPADDDRTVLLVRRVPEASAPDAPGPPDRTSA